MGASNGYVCARCAMRWKVGRRQRDGCCPPFAPLACGAWRGGGGWEARGQACALESRAVTGARTAEDDGDEHISRLKQHKRDEKKEESDGEAQHAHVPRRARGPQDTLTTSERSMELTGELMQHVFERRHLRSGRHGGMPQGCYHKVQGVHGAITRYREYKERC